MKLQEKVKNENGNRRTTVETILIVDDNQEIVDLFSEILASEDYRIFSAKDGISAIQTAGNLRPDLILLDVELPGLNGIEVCRTLRKMPETKLIPVITITGQTDKSTLMDAIRAGSDDFIVKPPDVTFLKIKVKSLLNLSRLRTRFHEKEKFDYMVNTMSDGLLVTDGEGKCTHGNAAAEKMFGVTLEDIRNTHYLDLLKSKCNNVSVTWEEILVRQQGEFVIYDRKRKQEILSAIRIRYNSVHNPISGKDEFIFINSDETDKEKSRQKLKTALEKAQDADRVKSLFLANISHEIRTPLNAILGFSTLMENNVRGLLNQEERNIFDYIRQSGERLMKTVHEIADIAQLEAGSFNLVKKPVELVDTIRYEIRKIKDNVDTKGLSVKFDTQLDEFIIMADRYCISQALENVLDNAVKFTEKGGIRITLQVRDDEGCILSVSDTGVGMSQDYQRHLFELFSQESNGYSKKYQGIGLGLALTKRYLELNDVGLSVSSKPGSGTTIRMMFLNNHQNPAD